MKKLVLGGIAGVLAAVAASAATPARPNLVLMLVDDMGIMDTSLPFLTDGSGTPKKYPLNEFYRTPNMERLAAQGVRFNNFYAMSVCSPTRVSIMTGQNSARHRTTNWISPEGNNKGKNGPPEWNWAGLTAKDVALPRLLAGAGYRTIHVGKGHFGPWGHEGEDPVKIGFDVNIGGTAMGQPGSYYGKQNYGNVGGKKKTGVPGLEKYWGSETFLTEALTIEANGAVDAAVKAEKPFFLYFAQYAVHGPHQSDPRFAAHYKDSGKPPQAQAFATLIEGMDKSLGEVLDHLEKIGQAENTLIIFLGDNGSDAPLGNQHVVACAAPLRGKKGAHYEGGMRVPFIAAWAKPDPKNPFQQKLPIAAGAVQTQIGAVYDLLPTLLGAAGVDMPRNHVVDGASLAGLFAGKPDPAHPQRFLMHFPHEHRTDYFTTYRDGDWKVIYHYFPTEVSGGSHYQLYNLATDPFESTDLAASKPDELKRLMKGLMAEMERTQALYPVDPVTKQPVRPVLP